MNAEKKLLTRTNQFLKKSFFYSLFFQKKKTMQIALCGFYFVIFFLSRQIPRSHFTLVMQIVLEFLFW